MGNLKLKPEDVKITETEEHDKISEQQMHEKRQWAILDCIRQYPGHTEKWYADIMTLNHICARKTTLGIIKDLVSCGSINDDKIGNSFHSYVINHDDDYIMFNEMLQEFQSIEEELLSYYDRVWNVFYEGGEPVQKLGRKIWSVYDDQLSHQLYLLKVLAVDMVGVLLRIYSEMVHKYDHMGSMSIIHNILRIVDLVTAYDKKQCLKNFNDDLSDMEKHMESDSVGSFLLEREVTCEQLVTRMLRFERDLNDKFSDKSSEDSAEVSKNS